MDLESTLTSRETINLRLREVLDEATGKWGIRVNRVEIKAIDPPRSIQEAMEKQMRAERDKRAVILQAEGHRQSLILTAEGTRNKMILEAEGRQQAKILEADGEARALERVFQAVHDNDADPQGAGLQVPRDAAPPRRARQRLLRHPGRAQRGDAHRDVGLHRRAEAGSSGRGGTDRGGAARGRASSRTRAAPTPLAATWPISVRTRAPGAAAGAVLTAARQSEADERVWWCMPVPGRDRSRQASCI